MQLGDWTKNSVHSFGWTTNAANGASVNSTTPGSIVVYRGTSNTPITAGVTDSRAPVSVGVHRCTIDTSNAAYAIAGDFRVVLEGAVIDGQTVNAVIAEFSVENRVALANVTQLAGTALGTASALYQQQAREAYGVSGTVYHVKYAAGEDLTKDGLSWATAKETAGPGVKTVIEAATAGDLVLLGAGTFALGNLCIDTPNSVSWFGSGRLATIITSTYSAGFVSVIRPGNYSRIGHLSIVGLCTTAFQFPFGNYAAQAAFTNAELFDAIVSGDTDALYVTIEGSTLQVRDCLLRAKYDAMNIVGDGIVVEMWNTSIRAEGPSVYWPWTARAIVNRSGGTVIAHNCDIHASGGENITRGADIFSTLICFGGQITSFATSGSVLDVHCDGGIVRFVGVEYDRTKVIAESGGQIVDVGRIVTDSNGNAHADVKLVKTVDADTALSARVDASVTGTTVATNLDAKSSDILAAAVASQPTAHAAGSSTDTTGTVIAGDYTDTVTINEGYWTLAPKAAANEDGFGLDYILHYNIGLGRVPNALKVVAHFDAAPPAGDRAMEVWAYHYTLAQWTKLTNDTTHFDDSTTDETVVFTSMTLGHVCPLLGDVQIRLTSTSTDTDDRAYIDQVLVSSVVSSVLTMTAVDVRVEMDANSTKLIAIAADVAGLDGEAIPAAPDNTSIAAILGQTGTTGVRLADAEDVYHADVFLTIDTPNQRDEYTVQWHKNGTPVTSGVTGPTIQVVRRSDGGDLVAEAAMTQIGSTGAVKYDSTVRLTKGEAAVAVVRATIDGAVRTWRRPVGRDL